MSVNLYHHFKFYIYGIVFVFDLLYLLTLLQSIIISESISVNQHLLCYFGYGYTFSWGLPWWPSGKELACNAGDPGLIFGLGKSPGEGNGYPFQSPCLGNPMDKEAWRGGHNWVNNTFTSSVSLEANGYAEEGQVQKKLMSIGNGESLPHFCKYRITG